MSQRHLSNAENTTPKKAGYDESPSSIPSSSPSELRYDFENEVPAELEEWKIEDSLFSAYVSFRAQQDGLLESWYADFKDGSHVSNRSSASGESPFGEYLGSQAYPMMTAYDRHLRALQVIRDGNFQSPASSSSARSHPSSDSFAGSRRQSLPADNGRRLRSCSEGRASPEESDRKRDLVSALPQNPNGKLAKKSLKKAPKKASPRMNSPKYLKNREEAAEYKNISLAKTKQKGEDMAEKFFIKLEKEEAVKTAIGYIMQLKKLDFDHLSDDGEEEAEETRQSDKENQSSDEENKAASTPRRC